MVETSYCKRCSPRDAGAVLVDTIGAANSCADSQDLDDDKPGARLVVYAYGELLGFSHRNNKCGRSVSRVCRAPFNDKAQQLRFLPSDCRALL